MERTSTECMMSSHQSGNQNSDQVREKIGIRSVDIRAAKPHLSRLVEDAAAGGVIVITKRGRPVARLCPLVEPRRRRELGRLDGKIQVRDNFDYLYAEDFRRLFDEDC